MHRRRNYFSFDSRKIGNDRKIIVSFSYFSRQTQFFFLGLANTSKINKKYIKCKTILFLLSSISFYQQIKGILKEKSQDISIFRKNIIPASSSNL
jgi:hypothetical protein